MVGQWFEQEIEAAVKELKLRGLLKLLQASTQLEAEDTIQVDEGLANQEVLEQLDYTCIQRSNK